MRNTEVKTKKQRLLSDQLVPTLLLALSPPLPWPLLWLPGDSPQICTKGHWSMLNLKKHIRVQILAVGQQFVITNGEETIGSPNFW